MLTEYCRPAGAKNSATSASAPGQLGKSAFQQRVVGTRAWHAPNSAVLMMLLPCAILFKFVFSCRRQVGDVCLSARPIGRGRLPAASHGDFGAGPYWPGERGLSWLSRFACLGPQPRRLRVRACLPPVDQGCKLLEIRAEQIKWPGTWCRSVSVGTGHHCHGIMLPEGVAKWQKIASLMRMCSVWL